MLVAFFLPVMPRSQDEKKSFRLVGVDIIAERKLKDTIYTYGGIPDIDRCTVGV
jgi:hypothetical protein